MNTHPEIAHSKDVSVKLFKSNFLEFFTHIHPAVVLVIWLPVVVYFLYQGIIQTGAQALWIAPLGLFVGLFIWTIAEYLLHRFAFHFKARNPLQERIAFLFHGVHHAQPQDKTRLVMPPVVSIPMAVLFYGVFWLVVSRGIGAPAWTALMFAGFISGYLVYDMTHYATHHFPMRSGYAKYIKRYHMQHHYKTPNMRFGVSSPLWDWVFRTMPG